MKRSPRAPPVTGATIQRLPSPAPPKRPDARTAPAERSVPRAITPTVVIVIVLAVCLTILALAACFHRTGGVRGFLRAGSVQMGIEIDPNTPAESAPRSEP